MKTATKNDPMRALRAAPRGNRRRSCEGCGRESAGAYCRDCRAETPDPAEVAAAAPRTAATVYHGRARDDV